jgi:hypothetical protein
MEGDLVLDRSGCWCMPFCCMLAALQVGLRYRGMDRILCSFFCCLLIFLWRWGVRVRGECILLVWIVGGVLVVE